MTTVGVAVDLYVDIIRPVIVFPSKNNRENEHFVAPVPVNDHPAIATGTYPEYDAGILIS